MLLGLCLVGLLTDPELSLSTKKAQTDPFNELGLHATMHFHRLDFDAGPRQNTPHLPHDVGFDSCVTSHRNIDQRLTV